MSPSLWSKPNITPGPVFGGQVKERLTRDTVRDATRQEIDQLKRENGELKHLVADLSLQVHRLKKTAIPMLNDAIGTRG